MAPVYRMSGMVTPATNCPLMLMVPVPLTTKLVAHTEGFAGSVAQPVKFSVAPLPSVSELMGTVWPGPEKPIVSVLPSLT